jgi:hypothetical protein
MLRELHVCCPGFRRLFQKTWGYWTCGNLLCLRDYITLPAASNSSPSLSETHTLITNSWCDKPCSRVWCFASHHTNSERTESVVRVVSSVATAECAEAPKSPIHGCRPPGVSKSSSKDTKQHLHVRQPGSSQKCNIKIVKDTWT